MCTLLLIFHQPSKYAVETYLKYANLCGIVRYHATDFQKIKNILIKKSIKKPGKYRKLEEPNKKVQIRKVNFSKYWKNQGNENLKLSKLNAFFRYLAESLMRIDVTNIP
jgi:hypothetical protein